MSAQSRRHSSREVRGKSQVRDDIDTIKSKIVAAVFLFCESFLEELQVLEELITRLFQILYHWPNVTPHRQNNVWKD